MNDGWLIDFVVLDVEPRAFHISILPQLSFNFYFEVGSHEVAQTGLEPIL